MNDNKNEQVSYFILEGIMSHFSTIIKRLVILCVVLLVTFTVIILGILWYASLPVDEVTDTVEIENDTGNAAYIGNDMLGDFNYGKIEAMNIGEVAAANLINSFVDDVDHELKKVKRYILEKRATGYDVSDIIYEQHKKHDKYEEKIYMVKYD